MSCFSSLAFWEQVCILIVVAIAIYRLWNLISPFLMQFLPALVVGIIQILIWVIIAVFVIHLIFELLGCVGGFGLSLHPFQGR
jgi:hypothetical protein